MYSPQEKKTIKETIINRVTLGQSILEISKDKNMISHDIIYQWLNKDKEFKDNYVQAKRYQSLFIWERINGVIYNLKQYGHELTNEQVQLGRLEIDTDKWYVSKLVPKIFGTAAEVNNINIKIDQISGMKIVDEAKFIDVTPKAKEIAPNPENKSK